MAIIQKQPGMINSKVFPTDKKDVAKARVNLVKMIHSEKIQNRIVAILQKGPENAIAELSSFIAQMLFKIISSIKGKLGANKVHGKLIVILAKLAIQEVGNISEKLGNGRIPPEAMGVLLDAVMEAVKQGPNQGQPQQQQMPQQGQQMQQQPQQQQPQQQGLLGGY